jgi:two-component sensor histidine kinase
MQKLGDYPDLLPRLAAIQRELVVEAHRMARAAGALEELPRGRSLSEGVALVLRAACEHLGYERAYVYLATGDTIELRSAWPRGRRAAGWLERRAIMRGAPAISRSGKVIAVPLPGSSEVRGALRLEGQAAVGAGGDVVAPVMRFAQAAAQALENALLFERVASQDLRIETLSGRLAEANHRIKNNLQALAGFLAQHQADASAPGQRWPQALRAGVGRIKAMAALHDALSLCDDDAADLRELTQRVCAETAAVDQVADLVTVVVSADAVQAAPGVCRAYALLLHELVSNALHHAYPAGGRGEVRVTLRRQAPGVALEVADDGVGMGGEPGECAQLEHKGLGLHIVRGIAEHELGGRLDLSSEKGTTARVEFPLAEAA